MELAEDYFQLFDLPRRFVVDSGELSSKYRALQQTVHPDRYASASDTERRLAMQRAAQINEAYQVLRDPLRRGRYLLELAGLQWNDERETAMDPGFLIQQMELREALADVSTQSDPLSSIADVLATVSSETKALIAQLGERLEQDHDEARAQAKQMVLKLQFLYKLRDEAEAREAELEDQL
jgi:molecular chaperone HscB